MAAPNPQSRKFSALSPTAYADGLPRSQFMDFSIRELWPQIPRIYRAQPGDVIVVDAGNSDYAMSGGNVCAIAQKRDITAFIIDGAIRDIAEVREARFPVFAKGCIPKPGVKDTLGELCVPITCGGVKVFPKDMIVADEEGIAVIPHQQLDAVWQIAKDRTDKDAAQSLDDWAKNHRTKIENILKAKGFQEPTT
mgnify:CR=1 FL=1